MGLWSKVKNVFVPSNGAEQPQKATFATREDTIYAPVSGVLVSVQEVHDEVISSGLFGQGYGILPVGLDCVYAPCNARAYQVLAELGAEKGLASRALFVQIGVYFLFPLLMAAAHATCAMSIMVSVIKSIGNFDVASSIGGVVAVAVALYGGYFLVTYFAARSIIFRGAKRMQ